MIAPNRWLRALVLGVGLAPIVLVGGAWGDAVVLKSGHRLEGTLRKTSTGWIVTSPEGRVTSVAFSDVASVELTGSTNPAEASAADKLASLRRAIEVETDIDRIIQRFERFAEANANTSASDEARVEADEWKDRKARGMVRVGAQWVTPQEHARLLGQLDEWVRSAAGRIASGQFRDAEADVQRILELDPRHISGLYLNSLILLELDKILPARRALEAVNSQIEGHAPTLNNLAVIAFRQNQHGAAMSYYEQAMNAAPADRTIIDNVAEALYALRDQQKRMPILQRVARVHAQQEAVLAARLAEQGLFRWGATWVDRATLDRLIAEERRIEERVRELERVLLERRRDVANTEDRIVSTDRSLRRMESDRYTWTVDGRLIARPLPSAYYDLRRDLDVLRSDRLRQIQLVEQAQADIRAARQDLPVPRYTGVQRPIGAEGTPVEAPPTTRPED